MISLPIKFFDYNYVRICHVSHACCMLCFAVLIIRVKNSNFISQLNCLLVMGACPVSARWTCSLLQLFRSLVTVCEMTAIPVSVQLSPWNINWCVDVLTRGPGATGKRVVKVAFSTAKLSVPNVRNAGIIMVRLFFRRRPPSLLSSSGQFRAGSSSP